jgi:hypothetical protein
MTQVLTGAQVDPDATSPLTPDHILEVGMGFFASRTLLSAVEMKLFSIMGNDELSGDEIGERLALAVRGRDDFLDALVSLGFLTREGDGPTSRYANTPETALFLSQDSPAYVGGILEMSSARLYGFWGSLTEGLRTGHPQNETKDGGESIFTHLYANPIALEDFLNAMAGIQAGNFAMLADKIDFSGYSTIADIGGAKGNLLAVVSSRHPHLTGVTFDLPPVQPVAQDYLDSLGLGDRFRSVGGDFFVDDLPSADVVVMGNVLHDWDETQKQALIARAYDAVESGGIFVAIENVIDDARRENAFGLLMSLNMLIETPGGFDYTGAQFDGWCKAAGFTHTEIVGLAGPASAAIAYKA